MFEVRVYAKGATWYKPDRESVLREGCFNVFEDAVSWGYHTLYSTKYNDDGDGITCTRVTVTWDEGELTITRTPAADAQPASAVPFDLVYTDERLARDLELMAKFDALQAGWDEIARIAEGVPWYAPSTLRSRA